jgi:hypothetical protein
MLESNDSNTGLKLFLPVQFIWTQSSVSFINPLNKLGHIKTYISPNSLGKLEKKKSLLEEKAK